MKERPNLSSIASAIAGVAPGKGAGLRIALLVDAVPETLLDVAPCH